MDASSKDARFWHADVRDEPELRAGDWASAFAAAHSLPTVRLEDALELVLLGAEKADRDRYERLRRAGETSVSGLEIGDP